MFLKLTAYNIFRNRYLIKNFAIKELKNKYSGSIIGFLWTIIHPLTLLVVYSIVFSWMLKTRLGQENGTDNFSVWLYCGLLPWIFFSETLARSTTVVIDHANLIKKTVFSSEILHVSILLSNAVNFFIGFIILEIGIILTGGAFQALSIVFIVVYLVPLILLTLGLSWFFSCLHVYFRDFGQLISVFLNVWFYATTIIYPITVVPEDFRKFFFYNPLMHVVNGLRDGLLKGVFISWDSIQYLYISSFIFFLLGQYFYQKTKKGFVDVI